MSDFLIGFINEEEEKKEKTGISFLDDPSPSVTSICKPAKTKTKFLKKSNEIHVIFKQRGFKDEEIIISPLLKTSLVLLNKSVIFYGPSGSGKTASIYNYMYLMKDIFPTVFVFAPTESEKGDFGKHVPSPMIFEELTIGNIRNIYLRQKEASRIYKIANDVTVLRSLFERVASAESIRLHSHLERLKEIAIEKTNRQYPGISEMGLRKSKINEIIDIFSNKIVQFYKKIISPYAEQLKNRNDITKKEKYALKFLGLNPRTLIIFDDATSELLNLIKEGKKKLKGQNSGENNEVLKAFFFKGRWANITHFYSFHDDGGLDTDIRKNAFYSVFCDQQVALAFFQRTANNFSSVEKKKAEAIINVVFDKSVSPRFAKLVYAREEKKFYYLVADEVPEDFKMCSRVVRNYCEKVKKKTDMIDTSNPFSKKFEEGI